MRDKSQLAGAGRPLDSVDKAVSFVDGQFFTKRKAVSEGGFSGAFINSLDEGGKHATRFIGGSGGDQHVVGVPIDSEDGGGMFFEMFADPPVVISLKVANGNQFGSRGDGKLIL